MNVIFVDNSDKILDEFEQRCLVGLEEAIGNAEDYAVNLVNSPGRTGSGRLKGDISHKVDPSEPAAYVGVNVEHGIYQEFGTGIYAEGGGGRPTPWVYQDGKGNWHWTQGNKAHPFIKPSVADHQQEHINTIKKHLQGK